MVGRTVVGKAETSEEPQAAPAAAREGLAMHQSGTRGGASRPPAHGGHAPQLKRAMR